MSIIEKLKSEIQMLNPDDYKNAMLLRFGFVNGVTHSRDEVCTLYNISAETALQLEHQIITDVFKG